MSLDAILDDMASYLATKLPELKTSQMMGGKLNLEETGRRSIALPAAYVACPGTRDDGKMVGDKFRTTGQFVLVLLVRSSPEGQPTPQDRAHAIARFVSKTLAVVAAAKNWGNAEVESSPNKVGSKNHYDAKTDERGIAMWAITWEQQLALTAIPEPVPLDDFLLLHADYQITPSNPEIDAEDDVVLEGGQP